MKKKNLLTTVLVLALTGAVGIGATLAYLSDTTDAMTNTFAVGDVQLVQDETNVTPSADDNGPRTEKGNDYTNIQPGDTLTKDPTVTVKEGSVECYVFMQLTGADELAAQGFTFNGFDSAKWQLVEDADDTNENTDHNGIYQYYTTVDASNADVTLEALFTELEYDLYAPEVVDELSDVVIKSCAVQSKNMDATTALAEAAKLMK